MTALIVLIVIAFWIAPIIVGGLIGSHKGRPGLGVLLGIVLAWIGVIIVAVLSPTADAQREAALRQGFACPFCQEPVRHGASVCPHCQRDLPHPPPNRPNPVPHREQPHTLLPSTPVEININPH